MRCPHCGYVSFGGLAACRRCANPLPQSRPGPVPPVVEGDIFNEDVDLSRLTLPEELLLPSPPPMIYGGYGRRAVAALVDASLLFLLTVLAMILASLAAIGGATMSGEVTRDVILLALGSALVAAFVVSLAYHVVCWGLRGQTPGQILLGLQVVGEDGEEIGYTRALLRWAGYVLALLPLGLGLVFMFVLPRRRGLHDLLARTCVIRVGSQAG